jgi:hypothetical protein
LRRRLAAELCDGWAHDRQHRDHRANGQHALKPTHLLPLLHANPLDLDWTVVRPRNYPGIGGLNTTTTPGPSGALGSANERQHNPDLIVVHVSFFR